MQRSDTRPSEDRFPDRSTSVFLLDSVLRRIAVGSDAHVEFIRRGDDILAPSFPNPRTARHRRGLSQLRAQVGADAQQIGKDARRGHARTPARPLDNARILIVPTRDESYGSVST